MLHRPTSFENALALKARLAERIKPIAGGTDLVVGLNRGQQLGQNVLDLSALDEIRFVDRENGDLLIGAGATWTQLTGVDLACLAGAARSVGGPQVRNRGTIGGNLVTASPAGDGSVALLALDADVELVHATRGARWVKLLDFFQSYRVTALANDELIRRIRIQATDRIGPTAWYKIGKRGAVNISVVCAAATRLADGRIGLAFGSVAPIPLRARQTEKLLAGQSLTDELIARASESAMAEVQPIDDWRASADYRRAMCGVLTRRLLGRMREAQA